MELTHQHFAEIKFYLTIIGSLIGVVVVLIGLSARIIFSSIKGFSSRVEGLEKADLGMLSLLNDRDSSLHRDMLDYENRHGKLVTRISRVEWEIGIGEKDNSGKMYQRRQIDQPEGE